ncbi:hypothetical protein DBR32_02095 [Taibaiella sp. KBW10]|uniref:hypothetical protein n=1 Tax=Taibaiella sp. KBW10 TaxID=2153357 RepID=UPI000F5AD1C0|nr:hypothetical protein [Taibaiella sp. KBW10]RQO32419.1 hypothetical protein DBR32_02095 [Taibaiella sp. KBW10]
MKKYIAPSVLWFLSIGLTLCYFYDLIIHLNTGVMSIGGDGMKNYYTYLYYIQYDQGNHFSGMNYPFGEHIVFTDNMPALAGSIKWLSQWFPGIAHYSLGIMHGLLLLSLNLATYYIYKILRKYGAASLWAIVSALFITFFSPQLFKIYGHFGMGFVFYIPFTIYQLIRYQETKKLKYAIALFCCATLLAFIHLYNLAIIAVLIGFYAIAYLITERKTTLLKQKIRYLTPLALAAILSFGIASVYLKMTDKTAGRPAYPYGVLTSETQGKDLLVNKTPLGYIFQFIFGKPENVSETEGKAYVGLITIIVFLVFLYRFIKGKTKKDKQSLVQPVKGYTIWLWVALFQLLFAMGVPFVWAREFFADHISVLRQFRTLGRFIWPFYYLIMIYAALFVYHFAKQYLSNGKRVWAYGILFLTPLIWAIQLTGYYENSRVIMQDVKENYTWLYDQSGKNWNSWLQEKGYQPHQFQAALGLPFFHIGSEKLWIMDVNEGMNLGRLSKMSLQTGLPVVNVMMSRTSWPQTFETVNIIDGPFNPKNILNRFNNKPLLLLIDKTFPLKSKEQEWMQYATFIGDKDSTLGVYAVDIQAFQVQGKAYTSGIKKRAADTTATEGLLGSTGFYYVNHFDHTENNTAFAGTNSFKPVWANKEVVLDTIPMPNMHTDSMFNLSMWVKCNLTNYRSPYFNIYQYDKANNKIGFLDVSTKYSTYISGNWFFVDKDIKIEAQTAYLVVGIIADHSHENYFGIDELVLAPSSAIYFYKAPGGTLFLNNRPQKAQ